jgi:hypothetical protein
MNLSNSIKYYRNNRITLKTPNPKLEVLVQQRFKKYLLGQIELCS